MGGTPTGPGQPQARHAPEHQVGARRFDGGFPKLSVGGELLATSRNL